MKNSFDAIADPTRAQLRSAPLRIAEALRGAILSGSIEGGVPLRQEELASAFEVSRIPVREALRMLEAEGLIEFHPNRGAVVAAVTAEEVENVYTIRAALECAALGLSGPRLTHEDLSIAATVLDEINEQKEVSRLGELNRRFHLSLYSRCNRRRLLSEIDSYLRLGDRLLRFHFSRVDGRGFSSQDEHRAILAACRAGRFDDAATRLRSHILDAGGHLALLVAQTSASGPGIAGLGSVLATKFVGHR